MPAPSFTRSSGVLLHPSSLPGPFGVGDLGPVAYRWVETLAAAKQSWWQILPLGPTGFGDSPYQSFSAFAGNVNLLSPELLEEDGLIGGGYRDGLNFLDGEADLDRVAPFKMALVREAFGRANTRATEFAEYCKAQAIWLDTFAAFMAIRGAFGGATLADWPAEIRSRKPPALAALTGEFAGEIRLHMFGQFLFDRQWLALRAFAAEQGVRVIGDLPIFVAADSSDVWANPHQFLVDDQCSPLVVAGVPPDYFSEDGQHWGNPLYDWPAMAADGFAWWRARVRRCLEQADLVRLDHFRGFVQAWHIPAGEATARNGTWVDGAGEPLFAALEKEFGSLPFIAEDLGLITPDVVALRLFHRLPGMCVLQFALGGAGNLYWPHNYEPNTAVYTGTHDNDTTAGWYATLKDADRYTLLEYVGHPWHEPAWEAIRMAWASVAKLAIAPLQDLLGLGSEARMNVPGKADGNWRWRVTYEQFGPGMIERLAGMTARYNRVPETVVE